MAGDGAVLRFDREPRQVSGDWLLRIEAALVGQLHERDGRKGLRDGADFEKSFRVDRCLGPQVGIAIGADLERMAAVSDADYHTGIGRLCRGTVDGFEGTVEPGNVDCLSVRQRKGENGDERRGERLHVLCTIPVSIVLKVSGLVKSIIDPGAPHNRADDNGGYQAPTSSFASNLR